MFTNQSNDLDMFCLMIVFGFVSKLTLGQFSTNVKSTKKSRQTSNNQSYSSLQSIAFILFIFSTFVNYSAAASSCCEPNSDCSVNQGTCLFV